MNSAKFSIKRPIFITCIVLVILIVGIISYVRIGLDLMPDITFPVITVQSQYPGASPSEMETLVSKPLEDELAAIAGVKHIDSDNSEGFSLITLEFTMDTDIDQIAQDVRDKVSMARNSLPTDMEDDPVVQKYDPDSSPVLVLAVMSDLPRAKLYDLANEVIKPRISRVEDVGTVELVGGNKREIHVEIDQRKMNDYHMSMVNLVSRLQAAGSNVSVGKQEHGKTQTIFRSMGDYTSVEQIGETLLSFSGDVGNSVSVNTIGRVVDTIEDITSEGYMYYPAQAEEARKAGSERGVMSCVYLTVIKQSGTNTVSVCDLVKEEVARINDILKNQPDNSTVLVTMDQSRWIRENINETVTSIVVGIILAVLVVYLFLGNVRSTVITAIAIPNSLLGAIIVMSVMGYTFNIMTLMALSLVVGLLVDDAIVVRENIFRKLEDGMDSHKAAEMGTVEVMMAVIATTLAIISVFFPIGMLSGVVGKIFQQFGFTVIFAMLVSLFDALTVAPFLSAYFAGDGHKSSRKIIVLFDKFQAWLERKYETVMKVCLAHPLIVVLITCGIFLSSIFFLGIVKKTFFPTGDRGEFSIIIDMPPGTSLEGTKAVLEDIEDEVRQIPDLDYYGVQVGDLSEGVTYGSINVFLKDDRKVHSEITKENMRKILSEKFAFANPSVNDPGARNSGSPFRLVISGNDLKSVQDSSFIIMEKMREIPDLTDLNSTVKKGNPEFQVVFDDKRMQDLGVSSTTAGTELRYNVTGAIVGTFKEGSYTYDIRARLRPEQRDIQKLFNTMKVPNASGITVNLSSIAQGEYTTGASKISRRDKAYSAEITANTAVNSGLGDAIAKATASINSLELPEGVSYSFSGSSESYAETGESIAFALILAFVFIYLVLSSLYESFVTPVTILLAIPPALTGALLSLVVTGFKLDVFSMIGMVMLIGLVAKNSILLVDNAKHNEESGMDRREAVLQAGIRRLRPILMTTFAMLAGMVPLAMGIGRAAEMRQSMGIAIMGGIILSTLITLLVVPAVFEYVDRFRAATEAKIIVRRKEEEPNNESTPPASGAKQKMRTKSTSKKV